MEQTTIIAIAGLLSTGLFAAVVGPIVAGRLESRRQTQAFRHENANTDLATLRELVYLAAERLYEADGRRDAACLCFLHEGLQTTAKGFEAVNAFMSEIQEVAKLEYRFATLLGGGNPLHASFNESLEGLREVGRALKLACYADGREGAGRLQELNQEMDNGHRDFDRGRKAFLEGAHRLVGLRLDAAEEGLRAGHASPRTTSPNAVQVSSSRSASSSNSS